jgi:hypothetical protein
LAFESEPFICFLKVASSGIPGIGVGPLTKGFPGLAGIPGIGVPPFAGTAILTFCGSGIPGVEFPEGVIGTVENPGGKFFGSTLVVAADELALTLGAVAD